MVTGSRVARLDDDLIGINEIADIAGVSRQAVANWRVRFADFRSRSLTSRPARYSRQD